MVMIGDGDIFLILNPLWLFQDAVQSIPFLEGSFNLKLKFSQVLRKCII